MTTSDSRLGQAVVLVVRVRTATTGDTEACVEILVRLPDFFTVEHYDQVRTGLVEHRGWVAVEGDEILGFALVETRYLAAAEITHAAVIPKRRHQGVGTRLIEEVLNELRAQGVAVVEVKTLDASAGYEPYVATRAFWERRGFIRIDCIDPLPGWQPDNPSAIYVASLVASR